MTSLFDSIVKQLLKSWRTEVPTGRGHSYRCTCGRPVFFYNSLCLGCGAALGYEPDLAQVRALEQGAEANTWRVQGLNGRAKLWKRCENFDSPAGCNWLVAADETETLCISCRLNNIIPDLTDKDNRQWWRIIENAKRRLVAQLLGLGLSIKSKVNEDPEHGLMFNFLRSPENGPRVLTGHANGLITLNVEEADDAKREKIKQDMNEPYRTLLGHFRHEVGHYFWDQLIADSQWLPKFRELFGDEREDYAAALKRNYEQGAPPNWADNHISSYASVHPWEDWAECWAHYLHIVDSLDTALGFGLHGDGADIPREPFTTNDLYDPTAPDAQRVILLMNSWVQLTTVLNELARSMGEYDFYPFVMTRTVLRKLHFIQIVVKSTREKSGGSARIGEYQQPTK